MAKTKSTRSQEEEGEKTKKREKKVSRDAVEKSTKDNKRSRRVVTPPSSDEDVKPDITSGGAPVVEPKTEKKSENDKKSKKSKKASTEDTMAALPVRPASGTNATTTSADPVEDLPLFTIDMNPTPVDPSTVPEAAGPDESDDDGARAKSGGKTKTKTKTKNKREQGGLNRAARRRIALAERQREAIQKRLGVAPGSQERADEVQRQLDGWVRRYDAKATTKAESKRARKLKEAARLRGKAAKGKGKGKTPAGSERGRVLKEPKKQPVGAD